jgi:phosphatidylinositol 4-phosphatase
MLQPEIPPFLLKMIPKTAFRVYKTSDAKTIIESPWRDDEKLLEISDSEVSVISTFQQGLVTNSQEIMGLIGTIELSLGKYLLVVTSRTLACTIQSHKIWRITGGLCIPIGGIY